MIPPTSSRLERNSSRKYVEYFCTSHVWSTDDYSQHSAHLPPNRQTQQRKQMELCKQFLDYMAKQEDAILTYHASNMVLAIHSNASYLSKPKSCSRMGGHMLMAGKYDTPFNNGAGIGCSIHQCENSRLDVPNACGTQPPTTTHTNANKQHNGTHATHQKNITKSTQSH